MEKVKKITYKQAEEMILKLVYERNYNIDPEIFLRSLEEEGFILDASHKKKETHYYV